MHACSALSASARVIPAAAACVCGHHAPQAQPDGTATPSPPPADSRASLCSSSPTLKRSTRPCLPSCPPASSIPTLTHARAPQDDYFECLTAGMTLHPIPWEMTAKWSRRYGRRQTTDPVWWDAMAGAGVEMQVGLAWRPGDTLPGLAARAGCCEGGLELHAGPPCMVCGPPAATRLTSLARLLPSCRGRQLLPHLACPARHAAPPPSPQPQLLPLRQQVDIHPAFVRRLEGYDLLYEGTLKRGVAR